MIAIIITKRQHSLIMAALRAIEDEPETLSEYLEGNGEDPAETNEICHAADCVNTDTSCELISAANGVLEMLDSSGTMLSQAACVKALRVATARTLTREYTA